MSDTFDEDDVLACCGCGSRSAGYRIWEFGDRLARLKCEDCGAVNAELCCDNAYAAMLSMVGSSDA